MAEADDWRAGGFGVYVHWPFCLAKCPYCDFNSHVTARVDHARWAAALVAELKTVRGLTGPRPADTIFFGGGTPSLMEPATVGAVIETVDQLWGLSPGAEVTLEANPTSVEASRFAGYAAAGVNRVSLGVQALNDPDLKALGRMHSAAEARAAFDIARNAFGRVSFDLIYARQHQTAAAWEEELQAALSMAADHLSLYQLTIEPGTAFGDRYARGRLAGLPPDDLSADLYDLTQAMTEAAGLPAYEISNHAAPGAESRHNLIYWRYGDYAGVGPGAHGRLTLGEGRMATETPKGPEDWLTASESNAGQSLTAVADTEAAEEYAMVSLRLSEGMSLARHAGLAGAPIAEDRIAQLVEDGFLKRDGDGISATRHGRPVLNAVLRALLA